MFIDEEKTSNDIQGTSTMSVAGTHISYESPINTPYITLNSEEFSWITEVQRVAIIAMRNTPNATFTITYTDNTTDVVRFAKEKNIVFTPLYEGSLKYRAVIPLAKII